MAGRRQPAHPRPRFRPIPRVFQGWKARPAGRRFRSRAPAVRSVVRRRGQSCSAADRGGARPRRPVPLPWQVGRPHLRQCWRGSGRARLRDRGQVLRARRRWPLRVPVPRGAGRDAARHIPAGVRGRAPRRSRVVTAVEVRQRDTAGQGCDRLCGGVGQRVGGAQGLGRKGGDKGFRARPGANGGRRAHRLVGQGRGCGKLVAASAAGAAGSGTGATVPGRVGGRTAGDPAKMTSPFGVTVPSGVARMKPRSSRGRRVPGGGGLTCGTSPTSGALAGRTTPSRPDSSGSIVDSDSAARSSVSGSTGRRGARSHTPVAA